MSGENSSNNNENVHTHRLAESSVSGQRFHMKGTVSDLAGKGGACL